MNENIFNTLEAIDEVKSSALDTQFDVFVACDSAYNKYCAFSESYAGDVDDLNFFTEGSVGEEYKKMKGENENAVFTILAALPRFIAAIIKSVFSKSEDTNKKLAELEKDKKFKGKLAKAVELSEGDGDGAKTFLDKLNGKLKKWAKVSALAGLGGGLLLHFRPAHDEKNKDLNKVTTKEGWEVCIDKEGNICMTSGFEEKQAKLDTAMKAALKAIESGAKDSDKLTEQIKTIETELSDMNAIVSKYDGKNAKAVGLTGIKGFLGKSTAWLKDIQGAADRVGANLKAKGEEKGGIAKPAAGIIDRVLRSGATLIAKMVTYCECIIKAMWTIISMPFAAVKELFTKNDPDHKKSDAEKAADAIEKDHPSETKKDPEKSDDEPADNPEAPKTDSADEDGSGKVEGESAVEEVPEGETVTQESTTVEEAETSEPVDPVVSSWYSK